MRKLTLLALLTVVFLFLAQPILAGPYDDFPYYARIFVTENSGQDLQNYPLKIRVDWKLGMKADFSDLRFTYINSSTLEETPICYWVESYSEYSYADVWVFIPYIPANETVELKMYYGNEQAESQSNYDCVFQGILLLEDNFTTDQGWLFENYTLAEPGYTVTVTYGLDTENKRYYINVDGTVKRYETQYARMYKSISVPYDGKLNVTVNYSIDGKYTDDWLIKVWLGTEELYSKDFTSTGSFTVNVENTVSAGTYDFKIGHEWYIRAEETWYQYLNVTYVKVRLIPEVSPAPSYGIVYMEPSEYISLEPVTVSIGEANVTGVSFGALDLPSAFYVAAAYEIGKYMLFAVPIIFLLIGSRRLSAISIFIACGLALLINHATGTVFFNEQVVGVVAFIGVLALFAEESKHRR